MFNKLKQIAQQARDEYRDRNPRTIMPCAPPQGMGQMQKMMNPKTVDEFATYNWKICWEEAMKAYVANAPLYKKAVYYGGMLAMGLCSKHVDQVAGIKEFVEDTLDVPAE